MSLGYSVFVSDPQGDHAGLAALRRVLTLGGDDGLPSPAALAALLRRFRSAVVDLSMVTPEDADSFLSRAVVPIQQLREETGLPQWVVIDEAHQQLGRNGTLRALLTSGLKGCCLVTYRPEGLYPEALAATDAVILAPGVEHVDGTGLATLAAAVGGVTPGQWPSWRHGPRRRGSCPHRSHCRPATGTASRKCHPPTGANLESIYRARTHKNWH